MARSRFKTVLELAELPYFELREGRLVLVDTSIGPVIDVHTHLALGFGLPLRVDLHAAPEPTRHYLPLGNALDLDVYQNRNLGPDDLSRMRHDLVWKSLTRSGMRATHTIPNLLREMRELGIRRSCILPIDLPLLSRNAHTQLGAIAGSAELIGLGSVHPLLPGIGRRLDAQRARGARGIKVHPAVQLMRPDHPRAMRLYRLCGERKLPVLFHCGPVGIEPAAGRRRSQVRLYRRPIEEHPETLFVLGHSGALQMEAALELAQEHSNVVLDLSCQSLPAVRTILAEAAADRIVFGTDWPFYHQAIGLAKVLLATEGNTDLRRKVLHGNAARIFGIGAESAPA